MLEQWEKEQESWICSIGAWPRIFVRLDTLDLHQFGHLLLRQEIPVASLWSIHWPQSWTCATLGNLCRIIILVTLVEFMSIRFRLMFVFIQTIIIQYLWYLHGSTSFLVSQHCRFRFRPVKIGQTYYTEIHTNYRHKIFPNGTDIFDQLAFSKNWEMCCSIPTILVMGLTLHACDSETRELLASPPFICRVKHRMNIHREVLCGK